MTTIDLMKQVTEIAEKAKKFIDNEEDKNYFSELQNKLNIGIKLINKEPTCSDINI